MEKIAFSDADDAPDDLAALQEQEWEASLETGMALIDEQHRAMFRQIKTLLDRSKADRVPDTLRFLEGYVVEHFGTEEHLHRETDYPRSDEHLNEHNAFIVTFQRLKREYEADNGEHSLLLLVKLTRLLLRWLHEHIKGHDQRFAEYYLERFPHRSATDGEEPPCPPPPTP